MEKRLSVLEKSGDVEDAKGDAKDDVSEEEYDMLDDVEDVRYRKGQKGNGKVGTSILPRCAGIQER